ncbi:MAG: EAL domain-containing protein, partial [Calditerricola sp.]|nr:EAL domain-containing protein [Calditerricola sp.]
AVLLLVGACLLFFFFVLRWMTFQRLMAANRSAKEAQRLASFVFQYAQEGIMITDAEGTILYVNPAFTAITGYTEEEVRGKNPRLLKSGRHDAFFYRQMWESVRRTGQWRGEIWNRRKNGEIYPEWLTISAIKNEKGRITHYVAVFTDITERKRYEEQIKHQALHDPLTDLPNRRLFHDRLAHAIREAKETQRKVAVLFLDLDRFKNINDTLGHILGDELLRHVAKRLSSCVPREGVLARIGGDEFAVLLPALTARAEAERVAKDIVDRFTQPIALGERSLYVSISVGISLYPDDGDDCPTLIKNADMAMYCAKEEGGNRYRFFTPGMRLETVQRWQLENGMRQALELGELQLVYQPQVEAQTGRMVGVEALLRWHHPEQGVMSPATFIPLAEETGFIVPIGDWVLRTACAQAKAWQEAGLPPIRVAVNLSARQFQEGRLEATVRRVLAETGLEPQFLELEITEGIMMTNHTQTVEQLHRLKALGVKVAIDDFGTGYSSLGYLKKFPIDTLKIDKSFIRDCTDVPEDAAIVKAVIALAKNLNIPVVAEGVENPRQLAFLCAEGCDVIQGYLYSPPVSAEEVAELLRQQSALVAEWADLVSPVAKVPAS